MGDEEVKSACRQPFKEVWLEGWRGAIAPGRLAVQGVLKWVWGVP